MGQIAIECLKEICLVVPTIGDDVIWSVVSYERLSRHAYLLAASDYWW